MRRNVRPLHCESQYKSTRCAAPHILWPEKLDIGDTQQTIRIEDMINLATPMPLLWSRHSSESVRLDLGAAQRTQCPCCMEESKGTCIHQTPSLADAGASPFSRIASCVHRCTFSHVMKSRIFCFDRSSKFSSSIADSIMGISFFRVKQHMARSWATSFCSTYASDAGPPPRNLPHMGLHVH